MRRYLFLDFPKIEGLINDYLTRHEETGISISYIQIPT